MSARELLCDLDGTLVDSRPVIAAALREVCTVDPDDDLAWAVGPPIESTLERLGAPGALSAYRDAYAALLPGTRPMPGAVETVAAVRASGVPVTVVTYKIERFASAVLEGTGIAVDRLVARHPDGDRRTKTDLLREARTGDADLFVGDHDEDASAAREVGVRFVRFRPWSWTDVRHIVLDGAVVFVRDIAVRSRLPHVPGVAVVDLTDPSCVDAYTAAAPFERAVGFYPHVRRELAELAVRIGVEPLEKRVLFADPATVLQGSG